MAEFVADGHKYGLKWSSPWGPGSNDKSLGFSEVGFVVSMGGGLKTLGLDGWGRPDNVSTGRVQCTAADGQDVVYFRLSYDAETGEACAHNATFITDILDQPLADNQVLVRLTFSYAKSEPSFFNIQQYPLFFAKGSSFLFTCYFAVAGKRWDLCFEFEQSKKVKVHSLTMRIISGKSAQLNASPIKTNAVALYLDNVTASVVGAGGNKLPYTDTNNLKTITNILPLALLYKSAGGGIYQINPSDFAKRSELEALINRVTALEEKTDG